ncbi:MAG: YicC family protein [Deltaproteobacteria bacterium]|nr:YicC family protein [Deltaproteobacteria bacterium]MBW2139775.1 YicC family protein [Deltaproteobacteria bacterium]
MISSMTAFSQAAGQILNREITIEIRTVNNRFRDIITRIPKNYIAFEDQIKKIVAGRLTRGRIEVRVQIDESAMRTKNLKLNTDLARTYHGLLLKLKEDLDLKGEIELEHLAGLSDIIIWEEDQVDIEAFMAGLTPILEEALNRLVQMRQAEGKAIAVDFKKRLDLIASFLDEIDKRRKTLVFETKNRLEEKITALTDGLELDQARLLQEVAYMAERSDITEEVVRLRSHIDQFQSNLDEGGVVGRRLEFLLQEMNRETNTISSKIGDVAVTKVTINIKSELEKLREQVQNLE